MHTHQGSCMDIPFMGRDKYVALRLFTHQEMEIPERMEHIPSCVPSHIIITYYDAQFPGPYQGRHEWRQFLFRDSTAFQGGCYIRFLETSCNDVLQN